MTPRFRTSVRRASRLAIEQLEDRCVPANVVPTITTLDATLSNVNSNIVDLSGAFTDPDSNDPHTVMVDWGDNSPITQFALTQGSRQFLAQHFYSNGQAAQAISSIRVIVTDQAFATQVVESVGNFDGSAFRSTGSVLGEPTRFTDPTGQFGGAVTPFNAPFGNNEILSLEAGEYVTVQFPVPVYDNPSSSHSGADFLVFGNSFYIMDFNTFRATGGVVAEPGQIEVSQDGINFFTINSAFADTAFPTNGYKNPTGPFDLPPMNPQLTDFGLPVGLQSFNTTGLTLSQIVAAYNGSGGGTKVDISSTGLPWIQYVRMRGAAGGVEVDALSVVNPLPAWTMVTSSQMSTVDETLGLYVDARGFYEGSGGANPKWLRGVNNLHGNSWYFLRDNGEFVAWSGSGNNGTVLNRFDVSVFRNPELLYDASQATLSGQDAMQAQQLDATHGLYVDAAGYYEGSNGSNPKWLRGTTNMHGNQWYFIRSTGEFVAWSGSGNNGTTLHQFDAEVFRNPELLFEASQATLDGSDAAEAQALDAAFGLYVDDAGFFESSANGGTKWLRGKSNANGNVWYFIRANGEFFAWTGSGNNGTSLGQFDPLLFLNPELLYEAAQPTLSAEQMVRAQQYKNSLGLYLDARGYYQSSNGSSDKWLRGVTNINGNSWYILRATGEFAAWTGRGNGGTFLYQFNESLFLNPEMLL